MTSIATLSVLYGYGLWISLSYGSIYLAVGKASSLYFALASFIAALFVTFFDIKSFLVGVAKWTNWLRATIFVLTQYFTFFSFNKYGMVATFTSAAASYICLFPLAHVINKERIDFKNVIASTIAVTGLLVMSRGSEIPVPGLCAGALQAFLIVITKLNRIQNVNKNEIAGLSLGLCPFLLIRSEINLKTGLHEILLLLIFSCFILITQYYFIYIAGRFSSNKVNESSQLRVVWTLIINLVQSHELPRNHVAVGTLSIVIATLVGAWEARDSVTKHT